MMTVGKSAATLFYVTLFLLLTKMWMLVLVFHSRVLVGHMQKRRIVWVLKVFFPDLHIFCHWLIQHNMKFFSSIQRQRYASGQLLCMATLVTWQWQYWQFCPIGLPPFPATPIVLQTLFIHPSFEPCKAFADLDSSSPQHRSQQAAKSWAKLFWAKAAFSMWPCQTNNSERWPNLLVIIF